MTEPVGETGGRPREPRRDRLVREVYLMVDLLGARLTGEFDRVCQAGGLSAAEYPVLWVVCLTDDPAGVVQGAISDGLITDASDVSRIVTRLEDAGLVTRHRSTDDRRVVRIRPTRKGRAVFRRVTGGVKALHRRQFDGLADEDLDRLLTLLNTAFWHLAALSVDEPAAG